MLTTKGNSYGTEKNFYVKTDSVSSTPELQDACPGSKGRKFL